MEINDKKRKIIEILFKEKELATSKIAFLISANLYQTEVYLHQLLENNIIEKKEQNSATYCRLKNEK